MEATIRPAVGVPGLFDVEVADGRRFTDLTVVQTEQLIADERLEPAGEVVGDE